MNRRSLQIGFAWLALVAAGLGLGVLPASNSLRNASSDIQRARSALEAASDRPAALERNDATLAGLRAFAEANSKPIPTEGDIAEFVRGLVTYLDRIGVQDRSISTGTPARENDILAAPMTLTMTSDFLGVFATLEHVESLPRLVRVSRLKLELRPDGALRADMALDVLFGAEEIAAADAKGATP